MQPATQGKSPSGWSVLAVLLSIAALYLAYAAYSRPTSDTPRAAHDTSDSTVPIYVAGQLCQTHTGAQVTLVAARSGVIVVSATVNLRINHIAPRDVAHVFVSANKTECDNSPNTVQSSTAIHVIDNTYPGGLHIVPIQVQRHFSVTSGSHSYFIRGGMLQGGDDLDVFISSSLVAVFYPD